MYREEEEEEINLKSLKLFCLGFANSNTHNLYSHYIFLSPCFSLVACIIQLTCLSYYF